MPDSVSSFSTVKNRAFSSQDGRGGSSVWKRERTNMYYNDTPDTVAARSPLYSELRGLPGLDSVKADLENIIKISAAGMRQTDSSNQFGGDSPASFHRYIFGPPGVGRRMAAKVYADVFIKLGVVKGRETNTISVASLSRMTPNEVEAAIRKPLGYDSNVGVFIIEDVNDTTYIPVDAGAARNGNGAGPRSGANDSQHLMNRARFIARSVITSTLDQPRVRGQGPILILVSNEELSQRILQPVTPMLANYRQLFAGDSQVVPLRPYTTQQLLDILVARVRDERLELKLRDAQNEPLEMKLRHQLDAARLRPGFDNARYVGRLARMAAVHYHSRLTSPPDDIKRLQESDFDETTTMAGKASNVHWRDGIVGNADILLELESISQSASAMRDQQLPNLVQFFPLAFILHGDAGTGKTTLARTALATLYYQLGFLGTPETVEHAMSELLGGPRLVDDHSDPGIMALRETCRGRLASIMESTVGRLLLIQNQEPVTAKDIEPLAIFREIALSCIKDFMAPPRGKYMQNIVVVWEERSVARLPPHDILDGSDKGKFFRRLNFVPINNDAVVVELLQQHMALANLSVEEVSLMDNPTDPQADNGGIPMRILRSGHSRNRWELIALANEIIQDAYNATGPVKIIVGEADGSPRAVIVTQRSFSQHTLLEEA
ncbi:p-loop containing nucleoside triphosphate hydrolase protein [Ophiostoma piceae UAMH 11346]|uniref:p-loop containing nucleoside triphosphate hydrolase protein n=1 Tax=Ophiostoma piceae (strain UAMH 11346) TaxID=1262450 RepID=S3D031_OPHP1|nr:p-loop containing nucleoside triphosphate hydrolase protein [Ophiostoma piceae UAMH 11346]